MANAIVGSFLLVGLCALISTPIGILAGIYLAEYGHASRFASVTRFVTDIMLSAPSIVIGLFVYAIAVATVGNFSGWAGTLALSLIAVPVVVRTTENMLKWSRRLCEKLQPRLAPLDGKFLSAWSFALLDRV